MSYNNFTDADAAWRAAFDHEETCVAIIKHANPCGIAVSSVSVADAHRKAHECDPLSAFGGVIAANTEVSVEMAEYVSTIFTEVIVAPAYAPGAVDVLARKKNIRVLVASEPMADGTERRQISGGLLLQQRDRIDAPGTTRTTGRWRPVRRPTRPRWRTWCSRGEPAARSNPTRSSSPPTAPPSASAWVRSTASTRRGWRWSARGDRVSGAVAASDAFFPFPDGLETLTAAGVKAIVHPGGSVRDDEVTAAAARAGVTLYLTGARHFAH